MDTSCQGSFAPRKGSTDNIRLPGSTRNSTVLNNPGEQLYAMLPRMCVCVRQILTKVRILYIITSQVKITALIGPDVITWCALFSDIGIRKSHLMAE